MSISGSSSGDAWKIVRSPWACTSSPQSVGGPRVEKTGVGNNLRIHAYLHQHRCRPTSAPMLNRYILFDSYFSIFLPSTYGVPLVAPFLIPIEARHPVSRHSSGISAP